MQYRFVDAGLLRQAMNHRSWCAEHPGDLSNERLEFLGDAVLGMVAADMAYRRHAELPEGKLTDLRKSVVNASALASLARTLGLGEFLKLGKGERAAGGSDKPSILSDALEAVFGAVYLDGGPDAALALISGLLSAPIDDANNQLEQLDHKTVLQELVAHQFGGAPLYVITQSGPDHAKQFVASVVVQGVPLGRGEGRSKKQAEQAAAREAIASARAAIVAARESADA